jgi:glycosyltransferase involved in cell wall biosynthesis
MAQNMTKNKKNIVFILPLLCAGGAERALITLMNNIDLKQFTPILVVLNEEGPAKEWVSPHVHIHTLGGVRVRSSFFLLKKKLKELNPDAVVTTMTHSNCLVMALKPFFPDTKFIIREAVIPTTTLLENKRFSFVIKILYKCLYPYADLVLSPSQDIIDEFRSKIGIDISNHKTLYNQVDFQKIQSQMGLSTIKDQNIMTFTCVGRLSHQKGFDRLIEMLKDFKPNYSWRLNILGEGPMRHLLEKLITDYKLSEHITLYGEISPPWEVMKQSDYLLLPSRWEGMPNVVLESLACGTPVISHQDANGIVEIKKKSFKKSVIIAQDMQDMLEILTKLKIPKTQKKHENLLPKAFTPTTIMEQFQSYL